MPAECRRALEIREAIGSAAVKKVYAMRNQVTCAAAARLIVYCAADWARRGTRTAAAEFARCGRPVLQCGCGRHFGAHHTVCPWCKMPQPPGKKPIPGMVCGGGGDVITVVNTRDLATVEYYFGDALAAISGCLRGLFIAADGHDLGLVHIIRRNPGAWPAR